MQRALILAISLLGLTTTPVIAQTAAFRPLPVPPVAADEPRPQGNRADLKVLDWAGFKAAVSYSLDDSQPSQAEHLNELLATGVPMTEYVNLNQRSNTPNFDSVWNKAVKAGWELGNHTVHHCNFGKPCSGVDHFDAAAELNDNSGFIINTLGAPGVWTFAYPFGDLGWKTVAPDYVFLGRGVEPGMVAPHGGDPFNLPVFAVGQGQTAADFDRAVDEAHSQGEWLIFLFHSLRPTTADWYAGVQTSDMVADVGHAKALDDVWIDTVVAVGAYWRGQQILEQAASGTAKSDHAITWRWSLPAHFPPGAKLRVTIDGGVLSQGGKDLPWNSQGYYEVDLDAGSLSWRPA